MSEGKVIHWHKQPGEPVREGEAILTIETDKTEVEVESPVAGVMGPHAAREGDTVAVGGMLVTLLNPGESPVQIGDSPGVSAPTQARVGAPAKGGAPAARRTLASPRARRLAAEHGIELGRIVGHGSAGAVTVLRQTFGISKQFGVTATRRGTQGLSQGPDRLLQRRRVRVVQYGL
jgi:2-oxoglutarate dehydrogenase E2 component (dihydrolipoamide succinyltransferase)